MFWPEMLPRVAGGVQSSLPDIFRFTLHLAESPPDSLATQGPIHPQPHPVPLHFMDPPHSKHRICLQQSTMHPCFVFIAACAYYTVVQVVPQCSDWMHIASTSTY
jgi:hypothetical protein